MGISIWQLLIILAIVLLLFGTKRLRNLGGELGGAIKSFRGAMSEEEKVDAAKNESLPADDKGNVINGEATREKDPVER